MNLITQEFATNRSENFNTSLYHSNGKLFDALIFNSKEIKDTFDKYDYEKGYNEGFLELISYVVFRIISAIQFLFGMENEWDSAVAIYRKASKLDTPEMAEKRLTLFFNAYIKAKDISELDLLVYNSIEALYFFHLKPIKVKEFYLKSIYGRIVDLHRFGIQSPNISVLLSRKTEGDVYYSELSANKQFVYELGCKALDKVLQELDEKERKDLIAPYIYRELMFKEQIDDANLKSKLDPVVFKTLEMEFQSITQYFLDNNKSIEWGDFCKFLKDQKDNLFFSSIINILESPLIWSEKGIILSGFGLQRNFNNNIKEKASLKKEERANAIRELPKVMSANLIEKRCFESRKFLEARFEYLKAEQLTSENQTQSHIDEVREIITIIQERPYDSRYPLEDISKWEELLKHFENQLNH